MLNLKKKKEKRKKEKKNDKYILIYFIFGLSRN